MFLKHKRGGDLVEVLTVDTLYNPCKNEIIGRFHAGEELQDPETFLKSELIFTSGEALPMCWLDSHYQERNRRSVTAIAIG